MGGIAKHLRRHIYQMFHILVSPVINFLVLFLVTRNDEHGINISFLPLLETYVDHMPWVCPLIFIVSLTHSDILPASVLTYESELPLPDMLVMKHP